MRSHRTPALVALAIVAFFALLLAATRAACQPRQAAGGVIGGVGARGEPGRRAESMPVKEMFGVPLAVRLIQSDEPLDRIRGVERLGAIGTTEAIDALVEQLEQGAAAARDPRARLTAARILAAHTKRDNVRQLLIREATDSSTAEGRSAVTPLGAMIRSTAALALARGGDKKSLAALVNALLSGGLPSEAATSALRAFPPASLESFLEGRKRLTPQLATFLGELGDLRAIERLRAMLQEKDAAGQVAAAVALAKLGDETALPLAREWLKKSEPRLRRAAAEVAATLGAPEASAAVAALLASEATREDGLRLALRAPLADLAAPLAAAVPSFEDASRPRAVAAIGRAGGARAIRELVALLGKPELRTAAAHALATMPGEGAREALGRAMAAEVLRKGEARRLLLRAAVVRALALGDPPEGLREALLPLLKAEVAADRAVAAFGLIGTGAITAEELLRDVCSEKTCDTAVVAAAARAALAGRPGALDAWLPILTREVTRGAAGGSAAAAQASPLAQAAAVVLLAHPDGDALSTSMLASFAEAGGPLAPLAARALPSRDAEPRRGRLKRLLEGSDPVVRAHLALGLGRDPEPSAVALLTSAYRFEDNAAVRRAIVRALSRRVEVQRLAVLTLARDLDPDSDVRTLARAALGGRDLDPSTRTLSGLEVTRSIAWIVITPNEGKPEELARAVRLSRADGIALPLLADPDGVLLVPGLPPGGASLWIAP
jgi:cellulose synthase operon protein C